MRLSETFWIAPKGHPFICFDNLQHNGCRKIAKGPPFTFFGFVTLFKNLILKFFFGNFFHVPKGSPLQFFFQFLQPAGVSQSPKGPPFSILSLRYGADFGRSRLVFADKGGCKSIMLLSFLICHMFQKITLSISVVMIVRFKAQAQCFIFARTLDATVYKQIKPRVLYGSGLN